MKIFTSLLIRDVYDLSPAMRTTSHFQRDLPLSLPSDVWTKGGLFLLLRQPVP
jgi:hypothetical protein